MSKFLAFCLLPLGLGAVLSGVVFPMQTASTLELFFFSDFIAQFSSPSEENLGQMLPITAQTTLGSEVIELEVARTPTQQQLGLMYRTSLPDNRGMLFSFSPPRVVGFWMKNCKISLDMIFIRNGIVQAIQVGAPPCTTEPCPTYGPQVPVDQVIEVRGGRTQALGVKPGDRIEIEYLNSDRRESLNQ
ncbi:DUF192 domain-containing protein [Lyngbya aestuarii]|uniref:DUF192 domain-containing protein n=1 Tax=Lyngbya aestuarii TaxID=118322 RepID=UPI0005909802|nr:DUF192 domain-containing protein [Lyngbya aestuarii]